MDNPSLLSLKSSLESVQKNTSNMLTRLKKFDERLNIIDNKMKPIQTTTEKYSKAKDNITITLIEIEKTYDYFRISFEAKDIITNSFTNQNSNDDIYIEYFDVLVKLLQAKNFFMEHKEIKSSNNVLNNINLLLKVSYYYI